MVINIILAVLIGIFILLGIVGIVLYLIIKSTAEAVCSAIKGVINEK